MLVAARIIGGLILVQGFVGLAAPNLFLQLIQLVQTPPTLYVAAVVRIAFGVVLVLAAPMSRAPWPMRILGVLVIAGGVLTPFIGVHIANVILGWWSQGSEVVRAWAAAALLLGSLIIYATGFQSRAA